MSQTRKNRVEKIEELIAKLITESDKGVPVILEGRKDAETLRALCIEGPIIMAKNSQKSIIDLCDRVELQGFDEVILLLDFDRRGVELTRRLKQCLEKIGIQPNLYYWEGLKGLTGKDLKDIEGLVSYLETLKKKCESRKL